MFFRRFLLSLLAVVLLFLPACQKRESEAVNATAPPASSTGTLVQTMTTDVSAPPPSTEKPLIVLGKALGTTGNVEQEGSEFVAGSPLYTAVRNDPALAGQPVRIVVSMNGQKVAEETRAASTAGDYTVVDLQATKGWAAGSYKIEAYHGTTKLGEKSFTVKAAV